MFGGLRSVFGQLLEVGALLVIFAQPSMLWRIRGLPCAELTREKLALNGASHTASCAFPLRNPRLIPAPLRPLPTHYQPGHACRLIRGTVRTTASATPGGAAQDQVWARGA